MSGFGLSRRRMMAAAAGLAAGELMPAPSAHAQDIGDAKAPQPFSFERLIESTRQLAEQAYAPPPQVPEELAGIPREVWDQINRVPGETLWTDWPSYRIAFYLPGGVYRTPVAISIVEDGVARRVPSRSSMFDLSALENPPAIKEDLGFAGFRVLYPLEKPESFVDLLSFLGASYFRAAARGTNFGASARGLALDTGLGRPEEFPFFRHFWIQRPAQAADPLTVYALLDSPSVAGAFRFDVVVREQTRIAVDANLFFRSQVEQVGIAPLTGMFFFGPNDPATVPDYRPALHGVQGLSMWTGDGEVIWRPVVNPNDLRLSVFQDADPRGFGLLQRARDPAAYQDLDQRFDRRPNLWVEPRGSWGKGSIRLIEIPTTDPGNQNIVAFWTPEEPTDAGREVRLAYTLIWSLAPPIDTGLFVVHATRLGVVRGPDGAPRENMRRMVVDFVAPAGADVDPTGLKAEVSAGNAALSSIVIQPNPIEDGGWRLSFVVERQGTGPIELRAVLQQNDKPVSEVWLYRLDSI